MDIASKNHKFSKVCGNCCWSYRHFIWTMMDLKHLKDNCDVISALFMKYDRKFGSKGWGASPTWKHNFKCSCHGHCVCDSDNYWYLLKWANSNHSVGNQPQHKTLRKQIYYFTPKETSIFTTTRFSFCNLRKRPTCLWHKIINLSGLPGQQRTVKTGQ